MTNSFSFNFFNKWNLLVFIVGLFASIQIRILGTLSISELIAVFLLPFINLKTAFSVKRVQTLLLLIILWMIGVIVADFTNQTGQYNFFKGIGNVIFLLLAMVFSYWLLKNDPKRILLFVLGVSFSSILQLYYFPSSVVNSLLAQGWSKDEIMDVYLPYLYSPFIVFLVSYLYLKSKFILSLIILEGYAIFALFNSSRSTFLMFSLSFFLLLLIGRVNISNRNSKSMNYKRNYGLYVFFLIVSVYVIDMTYSTLAKDGTLGEKAKKKYLDQASNEQFGILSGRLDFFEGLYGISENPIIGYGSYAKDKTNIRNRFALATGLPEKHSNTKKGLPGHSYIVGAWLFAGILAVPFWVYVIVILIKYLKIYLFEELDLLAYIIISIFSLLWSILFSPFSGRLEFSMVIITLVLIMNDADNKKLVNMPKKLPNAF